MCSLESPDTSGVDGGAATPLEIGLPNVAFAAEYVISGDFSLEPDCISPSSTKTGD